MLLTSHITDFEELDVLLFLQRSPEAAWPRDAIASELNRPPTEIARTADALRLQGLLVQEGNAYRFKPSSAALDAACKDLRAAYDADPVQIVRLMGELAVERMRGAARAFASAFKIRKPTGGD